MLVDWFTVIAQIINFLILVWLLKRFLYGRIVKAMDARQAKIVAQAEKAEEDRERARSEADAYTEMIRTFEDEHHARLKEAELEVKELRTRRIQEARNEVGELREKWGESLARQQADFVLELKRRSGEELCKIARRALDDLADATLEQQALRVFVSDLVEDADKRETLRKAIGDAATPVTISSSFPISEEQQAELTRELQTYVIGEREVRFDEDPELSCGITLHGNSHVVEWNMDAYVDELAREFEEAVSAESRGAQLAAELDESDATQPEEAIHD